MYQLGVAGARGGSKIICHGGWSLRGPVYQPEWLSPWRPVYQPEWLSPVGASVSARVAEPMGASVSARVAEPCGGQCISQSG